MFQFFAAMWSSLVHFVIVLPHWVHNHGWILVVFVLVAGIVSGLVAFWPVLFPNRYR